MTGMGGKMLEGGKDINHSGFAENKLRAGCIYRFYESRYYPETCGGYKGHYGTYRALMGNNKEPK